MAAIYLDYAATTPIDPAVVRRMTECLEGEFGNPSATGHGFGRRAAAVVEQAREQLADVLNAEVRDLIFTSGATESDNLAIQGAARFRADRGRHIVIGATEHMAVTDTCRMLEFSGFTVTRVAPASDGRIGVDGVVAALRPDTVLVSVMHANNETGVIHDIGEIGERVRAHGAIMHVDAAQTAGKLPLDVGTMALDLVSLSAHKNHGPKGVGALWIRRRPRVRLWPLLYGGGHERGLRAGTVATHQVVGMAQALQLAHERCAQDRAHECDLGGRLRARLGALDGWWENGAAAPRLPGILNAGFADVDGASLAAVLADEVALSTGSACTTGSVEPSHVLRAMGQDALTASRAVRLSWGRHTTAQDIERAAAALVTTVERLRGVDVASMTPAG